MLVCGCNICIYVHMHTMEEVPPNVQKETEGEVDFGDSEREPEKDRVNTSSERKRHRERLKH